MKKTVKPLPIERVVRSVYMGFLLHKNANNIRSGICPLTIQDVSFYLQLYNSVLRSDTYQLTLKQDGDAVIIRQKDRTLYLSPNEWRKLTERVRTLLYDHLDTEPLIFDVHTLEPLPCIETKTIGSVYEEKASTALTRRYLVCDRHIFSIQSQPFAIANRANN